MLTPYASAILMMTSAVGTRLSSSYMLMAV